MTGLGMNKVYSHLWMALYTSLYYSIHFQLGLKHHFYKLKYKDKMKYTFFSN